MTVKDVPDHACKSQEFLKTIKIGRISKISVAFESEKITHESWIMSHDQANGDPRYNIFTTVFVLSKEHDRASLDSSHEKSYTGKNRIL